MKYSRSEYIAAVMWHEGISRKEAAKEVKRAIKNRVFGILNNMVYSFRNNHRLAY